MSNLLRKAMAISLHPYGDGIRLEYDDTGQLHQRQLRIKAAVSVERVMTDLMRHLADHTLKRRQVRHLPAVDEPALVPNSRS
ncbi:hypothetical protein [Nonomuraea sp. NPDC052265]|uniref:hypothetical protein n=1 Tax=Nonomuraea sp. NPDC052265 TaxID=3364374 RepID=UPI0037C9DB22